MSSETLAILALVVATAAVFYQARAYHLSRRELSLKVEDLAALVHRLEAEIAARKALDEKHTNLLVASLTGDAEALNHATELSGILQETIYQRSKNVDGIVADIQNILVVHNWLLANENCRSRAVETGLLLAIEHFCQARIAQMSCGNEWELEARELRERYVAGENPDKLVAAKARVYFERETAARLAGKYTDRLQALNEQLIAARERFIACAAATLQGMSAHESAGAS